MGSLTLTDVVSAITSAALGIIPAGTIALLAASGAVVGAAVVLLRRVIKTGR